MRKIDTVWLAQKTAVVFFIFCLPFIEAFVCSWEDGYQRASESFDPKYSYISKKITHGPSVDFLFLGSSGVLNSIDAGLVERGLNDLSKGKIRVENFGQPYQNIDTQFLILNDLLNRTKVKTLFLEVPTNTQDMPHRAVRYLWNKPAEIFAGPFAVYSKFYAEKILGSAPNIWLGLRGKQGPSPDTYSATNGGFLRELGYTSKGDEENTQEEYQATSRNPLRIELADCVYDSGNRILKVENYLSSYQEYFFSRILELVETHRVKLYVFVTPSVIPGHDLSRLEIMDSHTNHSLRYFGIPSSILFAGLTPVETRKFFYNNNHLNKNGALFFSETLIKPLYQLYEKTYSL